MSLGLLGDYGSDSSSSPSPGSGDCKEADPGIEPSPAAVSTDCSATLRNFFDEQFEADTNDTSSEEEREEEDSAGEQDPDAVTGEGKEALPLPDLLPSSGLPCSTTGSVFSNPYKQAEDARLAVLSRHVGLSPAELPETKKQKKPRFTRRRKHHASYTDSSEQSLFDEQDSSLHPQRPKKRRSGLREDLVPPKSYMKTYRQIREAERPWTIKN